MRVIVTALGSFLVGGLVVGYLLSSEVRSPLYNYQITSQQHWMPDRWDLKLVVDDCVRLAEAVQESLAERREYFTECMSDNGFEWENKGSE